jgi:hypothetical protein
MQARPLAHKLIALTLVVAIAFLSTSCGTILYPERRGQPPGGPLDPGVVILDALGLLFFVVPGIVAFIIDFSNGTIYLPAQPYYGAIPHRTLRRKDLVPVQFAKEDLTREKIEEIVSQRTGRPVTLEPGRFRAVELNDLDEVAEQSERLADPEAEAPPTAIRFR